MVQDDLHPHPSTLSHAAAGQQDGSIDSWEENIREEERAWLTGPRPRDWWTGACVCLFGVGPDKSSTNHEHEHT